MEANQDWILLMWSETCKNLGIEVEYDENNLVYAYRLQTAMKKENILV